MQIIPMQLPPRHAEVVQEYDGVSGATTKVTYTVTTGKILFIELWYASASEGKKYIFELQDGGAAVASIGGGEDGNSPTPMRLPNSNPLGPFAAGQEIDIVRVAGDSGKDWSGGFVGYEEDE